LLGGDDFLSKLADERVFAVDQHQASHFDGAGVMRYHHRKKITVRVTGLSRRSHFLMHLVHSCGHHSPKLGTSLRSVTSVSTVLARYWRNQQPP
jgi:hypothetical protein